MAKIVRHDFRGIQDALNKLVLAEVRAALSLLPGKFIRWDGEVPLCHIILSPNEWYIPRDVKVTEAGIDEEHGGILYISGFNEGSGSDKAINWHEDDTDWLDVTDFGHLIDQIAQRLDGGKTHNLPNMSMLAVGYLPEWTLKEATEKTVTV